MRLVYTIIYLFMITSVFSQKNIEVQYNIEGFQQLIKNPKTDFKDIDQLNKYLDGISITAKSKGFFEFSIDSISETLNPTIYGIIGDKYTSARFLIGKDELSFIKKHSKVSEKLTTKLPLSAKEIEKTIVAIQKAYTNNGYPFAKISFNNLSLDNNSIEVELIIDRGPIIYWKKIHLKGDSSVSIQFIKGLLDIYEGKLFDQEKFENINLKIKRISFLQEESPSELLLTEEGAELYLYLNSQPVSSVNGIIGLQQNESNSKLSITGEVNLKLINALKRGEKIQFSWQSIREATQSLYANFGMPYLFKSKFGFDGSFKLYKRDSSFLELIGKMGIQYNLRQNTYLKLSYIRNNSSLLSGASGNSSYTNLGSTITDGYGIEFTTNTLDYIPNPLKGIYFSTEVVGGKRRFRESDTLAYSNTNSFSLELETSYFIQLYKRNVLLLRNQTQAISTNSIFENELYRFGGNLAQRGFNEDEITASFRSTFTIEYRFIIDRNSHASLFYDHSLYENNGSSYYKDSPFGFGVGFTFGTNIGLFNISYALGKRFDNPVLFSNGKIHFGYIAYF